ncbi:MAG: PilZ domain-containing protein [Planctomycetes bacterium]|jgi:hypothetical protein|nr:PilZ domain-containing protein [Planctomycetota bacterium]
MNDPKEKRTAERYPVNFSSSCDFISPVLEDFGPARVKNLSCEGVGLISSQPLDTGMLIVINLVNPAQKASKTLLTRVIHCTKQAGGTYLIGGNFVTPITYDELRLFVM